MLLRGELLFCGGLLDRVHLFDLRLVLLYLLLLVGACLLYLHDLLDLVLVFVCHELHFHVVFLQLMLVMGNQIIEMRDLVVLLLDRQHLLRVYGLELGELVDRLLLIAYLLVKLRFQLLVLRFCLFQFFALRDPDLFVFDQLLKPFVHQSKLVFQLLVLRLL